MGRLCGSGPNVLSVAVRAVGKTATLFGRKFAGKRGNVETGLTLLDECTKKASTLRPVGFTDGIYTDTGRQDRWNLTSMLVIFWSYKSYHEVMAWHFVA